VVYSTSWDLIGSTKNHYIPGILQKVIKIFTILHSGPHFLTRLFLFYSDVTVFLKKYSAMRTVALDIIDKRMAIQKENPNIDDVFGQQLNHREPGSSQASLSYQDLVINSINFIIVGTDTSASAIAALFFYLAHNPSTYAAVAAEVRAAFPTTASVRCGPTLENCKFLRAAVMEVLRINPSTPSPLWREVERGGITVDGERIPAGCDIGASIYSIHHNPKYHPEPWKFDINRWLASSDPALDGAGATAADKTQTEEDRQRRYAWMPFSVGPRQCVAKNFALMQIKLTLAMVLVRMDFGLADGELGRVGEGGRGGEGWAGKGWGRDKKEEFQVLGFMTARYDGPFMKFKKRDMPLV